MRTLFEITTPPQIPKKKATVKQKKALAKARGIRTQSMLNRFYNEAQKRFVGPEGEPMLSRRKYINRVRALAKRDNISIQKAHFELMHTFPYISKADNYSYQIQKYVQSNPEKRAELRKMVAEALNQSYVNTSVNWELFTYEPATESIAATFNNPQLGTITTIHLKIVQGSNSDDPNFVEIYKG